MVLRDKHRAAESSCTAMASDQPVKKKQRLEGPGQVVAEQLAQLPLLQECLVAQCLCGVPLRPFGARLGLAGWPPDRTLLLLSHLQLLLDVYLNQNYKGSICRGLADACDALVRNEHGWFYEVLELADHNSKFVSFLASRVAASFLIVAKDNIDLDWLQKIVKNVYHFDTIDSITVGRINFSLDVIRRVVEWKDAELQPPEDSAYINSANPEPAAGVVPQAPSCSGNSSTSTLQSAFSNLHTTTSPEGQDCLDSGPTGSAQLRLLGEPAAASPAPVSSNLTISTHIDTAKSQNSEPAPQDSRQSCVTITMTDSESFDTSHIKCLTIRCLEHRWPTLVQNIKNLLTRYLNITGSENCILTFLSLWENIISVKANLSVVDTKPFYMDLQSFVELLRCTNLPSLIYTQLLSLFNEVLCYGSTLALQDMLPEETCTLAHSVVRFVKDHRLLNDIRLRHSPTGFGFVGYESPLVTQYNINYVNFTAPASSLVSPSYGDSDQDSSRHSSPNASRSSRSLRPIIGSETDKAMLQKMVLLVLKSVAVTVKEMRCDSSDSSIDSTDYNAIQDMQMVERSIRDVLKKLDTFLKNALDFLPESPFTKILIHLFSDQDDYLIESMVCTLDITVGIVTRNSVFPDLIPMLNPILTFIEFLEVTSHDSGVLLDYLVSNETCFLLYLLRFLKYVRRNWSKFVASCQWEQGASSSRVLDDTMVVLIRLRRQISRLVSKSLFPYNISPVLRLLEYCESLYQGNDLS